MEEVTNQQMLDLLVSKNFWDAATQFLLDLKDKKVPITNKYNERVWR
jgi:hypothetical protein